MLWVMPDIKCSLSHSENHNGEEDQEKEKEGGRGRRRESSSLDPSGSRNGERVSGWVRQHHPLGGGPPTTLPMQWWPAHGLAALARCPSLVQSVELGAVGVAGVGKS